MVSLEYTLLAPLKSGFLLLVAKTLKINFVGMGISSRDRAEKHLVYLYMILSVQVGSMPI